MSKTGIRLRIADYLAGNTDAFDLEDSVSTEVWDAPPSDERQLGYDTLRLLAEAANGEWTDAELRGHLSRLMGMVTDPVSEKPPSPIAEGFLDRLTQAERDREGLTPPDGDETHIALMRYAHFGAVSMAAASETAQSSDRGFLRQPKDESNTQSPVPAELAAD